MRILTILCILFYSTLVQPAYHRATFKQDQVAEIISEYHEPVKATELAYIVTKVAYKYRLDPVLFAKILRQESGFIVGAINYNSQDYGIAQINMRTILAYGFDKKLLLEDNVYSIEAGAMVLSWFSEKYSHRENTWVCRYNVGTGTKKGKLLKNCLAYIAKL